MTRIAFLISEIASDRTRRILLGAMQEARATGAQLYIYAGKYLVSAGAKETRLPDYFQETAVFDYIDKKNTDVAIVDLREIGRYATAIKKEKFLESLSVPFLTLHEYDLKGRATPFPSVTPMPGGQYEALGRQAIKDALAHCGAQGESATAQAEDASLPTASLNASLEALGAAAGHLFHHSFMRDVNPYETIMEQAIGLGVQNGALFLFSEAVVNSVKEPWTLPEQLLLLSQIKKGRLSRLKEAKPVKSLDAMKTAAGQEAKGRSFLVHSLFLQERQIGLIALEMSAQLTTAQVSPLFMDVIAGAIRLIVGDQQLIRTQDMLLAHQKELDKDLSVLERLGNEDYLTKRLNRRGFFAQAYDLLQKSFHEGAYAVVAYIDMDSIKSINEFFGREEGDHAVKRVADILSEVFGKESVLGRIRGNEFAVLVITKDAGKAEQFKDDMAEQNMRLMNDTSKPYLIHLQFSICAFQYDKDLSLKDMLAETDENLQKVRQM